MNKKIFLICLFFFIMATAGHARITLDAGMTPELQSHQSIILLIDPENGRIIDANSAASSFYGYSVEQLESMTIQEINALDPSEIQAEYRRADDEGRNYFIFPHRLRSGEIRTVEVYSSPFETPSGKRMLLSIIHDATGKILMEEELQRYQNRLEELVAKRTQEALKAGNQTKWITILGIIIFFPLGFMLFQRHQKSMFLNRQLELEQEHNSLLVRFECLNRYANDIILLVDEQGRIVEANERAVSMYGYPRDELLQKNIRELTDPENKIPGEQDYKKTDQENGYIYETLHVLRDGTRFPGESSVRRIKIGEKGFFQHIIRDITERKQVEEKLQASLEEKVMLLREVHHRVKNNLAIISALLDMQRQGVDDPAAAAVLLDLNTRIRSIVLVHESLYQSENLAWIDFHDYLEALIQDLHSSLSTGRDIRFAAEANGVRLGIDLAIPCGMIVNELVTNAFKYAFPDGKAHDGQESPEIKVTMYENNKQYRIVVCDNGVGFPPDVHLDNSGSFGLRLVRMIGTHQLGGKFELDRTRGTCITLTFEGRNKEDS